MSDFNKFNNLDSMMRTKQQQSTINTAKNSLGNMHDKLTQQINKQNESDRLAQLARQQSEIDKRSNKGKYNQFF